MLGKLIKLVAAILIAGFAYLLFWPVPIDPVAWQPPENKGYVGDYKPNTRLAAVELLDLGNNSGPEDVAIGSDGTIYAAVAEGKVIRIDPETGKYSTFAETGGRPLGMEFDAAGNLIVADAYVGLLQISPDGKVKTLADKDGDGNPIPFADDIDITPDGSIYFSDATVKFGAKASGGAYQSSLLDLMEHGPNGRVLRYDPATGKIDTVMDGLSFANGVAADPEGNFILVVETGEYRILKFWLKGDKAGKSEVIIDNLPGFPDNINRGSNGTYWFGLASPRSDDLDNLAGQPFVRKIVQRLPAFMSPKKITDSLSI